MAVSEETLDRRRAIRIARPGRKFLAFVFAGAIGVVVVVGGLVAYHQSLAGRILAGVSVAGVDVGGMAPDDARALLSDRLRGLSQGAVTIKTAIGSTTIGYADVGRSADIDAMLGEAYAVGRGGSWLDETAAGIRHRLQPEQIVLRLGYDHDRAAAAVAAIAGRIHLGPIDATITKTSGGFQVVPAVDGSGVDAASLMAAVDHAMADPATAAGLVLTVPTTRISPVIATDRAQQAVDAARLMGGDLRLASGKLRWTIRSSLIRTWIGFEATADGYRPVVDRNAIPAVLSSIGKKVARPVLDAEFLRDRSGRIVGAKADHAGRALDNAATASSIAAAIESRAGGAKPGDVQLSLVAVVPKRTAKDVAQTAPLMSLIGSWTTYYQVAAHNGFGANITVPARRLNGTVVQPGRLFDFWGALGEVSFRTGYRLGGAIVGGHSVEGKALAGGICSASTTLFNAALRGGYEIDSRSPHWYYITRYPLGLDATVSGSQSMQFRNDTSSPILIRGLAGPGWVRFEIWSVPNGRTVSLSRPIVTNVVRGSDSVVRTTAIPAGTRLRTEWPVDGKNVSVTRVVRDSSGRVIHRETYISHYHRMIGILQIGI